MPAFTNPLTGYALACFMLFGICFSAAAQKLPGVQKVSLRAPANAKADGRINEWGNQFQAYNSATGVWYTVANDDDKLYFVIQAKDASVIHKMMRGCVTITINTANKKSDKNAVVITFPNYSPANAPNVSMDRRPVVNNDTPRLRFKTDSFMYQMNRRLVQKQKFLAVSGLKEITDSLVSVYNDLGINAKAILDHQLNYNYELAIPLKYLGLSVDKTVKFKYNIRLNGIIPAGSSVQQNSMGYLIITDLSGAVNRMGGSTRNMIMNFPTDFWGEYALALK